MLNELQCESFRYFTHETNRENGLVRDKTRAEWPASIAATGMALAAYPPAIERGFITRDEAVERTLTTLRFFWSSPQAKDADATGYKGFYYRFLDMKTGRRVWNCELSTFNTGFLLGGTLIQFRVGGQQRAATARSAALVLATSASYKWEVTSDATQKSKRNYSHLCS